MTEESRPLRLVERLSREHQQNRLSSMTNDYLEGWVDESAIDTSDTASPLQRLDENALEQLFKNWCDIVEERQIRREEIVFIASKAFASAGEVEEDRETHMNSIREALRAQFEEQFRFLREKKELSAKVSKKAERFDSTISLADFVSVMWEPLISTGIFDDSGTRLRVARATSRARQIVAMLTTVVRSRPPTSGNDLSDYIHDTFVSIDNMQLEIITWDQFVSHMIERVYKHSLQGRADAAVRIDSRVSTTSANGSVIYKDSFSITYPQHRQHWVHRVSHFSQGGWDSIVALDGKYAVVSLLEDFERQKGVSDGDEYALLMGAQNDDSNYKREQMQELLRVSSAAHISNGVHYFKHEGVVNNCEWISKERLFLTVATERKQLRFWNVHNRSEFRFLNHLRLSVPDESAVTSVRIDEKRLLSDDTIKVMFGTRSGYVLTGDIVDADQIKRSHKFQTSVVKLHRDAVTDMVVLPRSQRVVSCGLDGKIFGFAPGEDCERGSTQYVGHKRGVLSMAYSNGYEVFVSGGFEYFALCWAENLPRSPAFKLEDQVQPHQYPICSVLAVPRTPNVYTVDTSGVIKVFDVRTLKALGSWGAFDIGRVPTHVMHDVMLGEPSSEFSTSSQPDKLISSACYTGSKHRSIIVACRGVHRYMTESRNGDADRSLDLADPMVAVSIGTSSILTAGATIVRIWSIASGRITATHRTVRYSPSNVSSALVDDAGAKVITGHCDGLINVFQRDSGMLLRRYRFHDGKILYVKLDELHGVIFASCNRGQLSFWRDRDCASSSRGKYAHTSLLKPVEEMFTRRWTELPAEVNHEVVHRNDSIHPCALSRWTINRWCAFVQRQALARQGQGAPADVIRPIRTPNAFFNLFFPSRACSVAPQSFRIAVLSSKTVCRVIDYSVMPPKVTHSLFHGRDRPLISVGLHEAKNICVVSDGHGAMFVWMLTQDCAATLLCSTFNKCLVSSYSHPHEEFREVDNEGEEQPQSEVRIDDGLQLASEMPPYKVPEDAVPTITSVFIDIVRFIIVTGDDVGFVSLWEIEPVFCGSCEAFVALQDSRASGLSPRWVHAWRAHPVPIMMAHTTTSSNYAVVTAAADNMVSLWTIAGDWLGGLRQGPVVDRTWIFPYPLMNRSSLVRYRFEKLFQAFASGELARLRRVRDKEELDRPVVHPDLTSRLFGWARHEGDVRSQIVEVVEPKEAVKRHVGFVMRKRVTTSLRTRTLSRTNFTMPPKNAIPTEGPPPGQLPLEPHASSSDDEGHIVQFGNVVEEVSTLERNIWSRGKMHARLRRSDLDIPPLKLLPDMQLDIHSPTPVGSFQSRPLRRNPREVLGKVVSAVDPRPVVHRRASSAIPVLIRSTARAPHDESTNSLRGFLSLGGASVVSTHVSLTLSKVSDPASRSLTPVNKHPTQETPAQQSSTNQRCSTATLRQLTPAPEMHVRLGRPSSLPPFSLGRVVSK